MLTACTLFERFWCARLCARCFPHLLVHTAILVYRCLFYITKELQTCEFFFFWGTIRSFSKNIYIFTWPHQVLVAEYRILVVACMISFPDQGSNPGHPVLGARSLSAWTTGKVLDLRILKSDFNRKAPPPHLTLHPRPVFPSKESHQGLCRKRGKQCKSCWLVQVIGIDTLKICWVAEN